MSSTFQPPSKSLTPRDYQFIALVVIVFLIISIALVFANLTLQSGGDFYVNWVGSRAYLFDKFDPYSGEVPSRVQQLVYEDSAQAGKEPFILDTPFHILLLYFPFSLLSDPELARAIYTLFLELALFTLAILSLRLTDWEAPRFFVVSFTILAVFNFYSFYAIYESNPVLILGLIYAGILFSLREELDELAGALVAVSFYYWEVGGPFLFLVFLRIYYQKRTRVFAGFFMVSIILLAISFLLYPGWLIPFMRATFNNLRADYGFNVHTIFNHLWPTSGGTIAWIFTLLLVIILGYEWSLARTSADFRRFYWASCLSLAIAPLLGFRTELEHLSVLIIPLALVFAIIYDRWIKLGSAVTILLLLLIFLLPWALQLSPFVPLTPRVQEMIFLFLPLFTIIGLYWIRWWAIRPPRIWADLSTRNS